jgi:hypothetical protein
MEVYCIVFWLICGVIAYYIYQGKGRAGCWGFLVGFMLGPLGIVYALVRSPDTRRSEELQVRAGTARWCPHCGELIRYGARVCKHCGRDLV